MWDPATGIEVRIKPHDSLDPYREYKAKSSSELHAGDRNECFIEAVTGERFIIEVIAHPLFQWKKSRVLWITAVVDGGVVSLHQYLEKPRRNQAASIQLRRFSNVVDGIPSVCGMTFGETKIVDDPTAISDEEEKRELSSRGRIDVVIRQGRTKEHKKKLAELRDEPGPEELSIPCDETTKKVAIDNGGSHQVKQTVLRSLAPDNVQYPTWIEWHGAKNDEGEALENITFNFRYTSRMYLEIQGIISMISHPNTRDTAIDIESKATTSLPASSRSEVVARGRADGTEVILLSSTHVGRGKSELKVETHEGIVEDADNELLEVVIPSSNPKKSRRDDHAEEPLHSKRVKREETVKGSAVLPAEAIAGVLSSPQGDAGGTLASEPVAVATNIDEEEADITDQLEEIKLRRRLRELRRKNQAQRP